MQAKLIEYAYPTSTTATKAGFGKMGCWFISLYPSVEATIGRMKIVSYHTTAAEALEAADKMPEPYNWMHRYFESPTAK